MTDTISAINGNNQAASNSSIAISSNTKKRLQSLGLDPSKYVTEVEAQQAIFKAQQSTVNNSKTQGNCQPCTNCGKCGKSGTSSLNATIADIKDLASKMGIPVGNNAKIGDLITTISDKITALEATAGKDPTKLLELDSYKAKYALIANQLSTMASAQSMSGATILANYNKASLVGTA
ncbi:MAG: hypothetical protein WCG95_01385 [bacterium]